VYYCQDCGGANAANASSCRICGHQLVRERGGAPCQSCGAPTVAGANFCSLCGSATVTAPAASLAEVLPGSLKVDAAIADGRRVSAARMGTAINLGEGLDLPDWLKRAAAEQPFDPGHQTVAAVNHYGPPGGMATTLVAEAPGGSNGSVAGVDLGSRPPLSIPVAAAAASPDPNLTPTPNDNAAAASSSAHAADVADTSTFISEDDLPEWIRQLAAADEAKKTEERRQAAEAATVQRHPASATDPKRRRPLPGETAPTGPVASPWLSRREHVDGPDTIAAGTWGTATAATAAAERAVTLDAAPAPLDQPHLAAEPAGAEGAPESPQVRATSKPARLRVVLMAAIVLLVVALLAFMVLS
jgi:hypothetical protein